MPHRYLSVFVLWGSHCDELSACIFVTVLRQAGVRVKLVGLSGQRIAGSHGLSLVPDLAFHEVIPLAASAIAVVVPCSVADLRRFSQDPRLAEWLRQVQANSAPVIVPGLVDEQRLQAVGLSTSSKGQGVIEVYPMGEALLTFAQQFAQSLISSSQTPRS